MDWDREFAAFLTAELEGRPPPAPAVAVVLPEEDDDEIEIRADGVQPEGYGETEGQFFMIEYRDSRGAASRRRITVRTIKAADDGSPLLSAICHERKALRNFRADRILACIDLDGVVYDDVPLFLHETFGLSLERLRTAAEPVAPTSRDDAVEARGWMPLRKAIKPDATLLVALAQCDGETTEPEIAIALNHCLAVAGAAGFVVTREEVGKIETYLRRMKPSPATIRESSELLFASSREKVRAFLNAAVALMDADSRRHPAEVKLLDRMARDLTGEPLTL